MRSTIRNGGSLWSAGARDRFGSHLRILRTSGTRDAGGFLPPLPEYRSDYQNGPRRAAAKRSEPTEWATANGCRPFHGLDGAPNLTWGSAFGSTPGFTLPPAPRA